MRGLSTLMVGILQGGWIRTRRSPDRLDHCFPFLSLDAPGNTGVPIFRADFRSIGIAFVPIDCLLSAYFSPLPIPSTSYHYTTIPPQHYYPSAKMVRQRSADASGDRRRKKARSALDLNDEQPESQSHGDHEGRWSWSFEDPTIPEAEYIENPIFWRCVGTMATKTEEMWKLLLVQW